MAAAPVPWRPLGTLLVARRLLTEEQLEAALEEQAVSGGRLGEILVERGYIPHSTLSLALAEQYGIHPSVESGFGTGLRVALQGPQPELQLVPGPAAPVFELAEAQPPAVTHLEERLVEQWAQLAAVQEQLAAAEEELHSLRRVHDRRRAQAGRLLARLRGQRSAHRAVLEQLALAGQDLHSVHRLHERRRAQAGRLLDRLRMRQEQLATKERELNVVTRLHERRHAQAARLLGRLRMRQEQLATKEHELTVVARLHERRHVQASRLLARLRTQQVEHPEHADESGAGHLVFLQFERGYELLEQDGGPPAPDTRLELEAFPDAVFVVTSVGGSPLPNDRRSCVFAQRAFD